MEKLLKLCKWKCPKMPKVLLVRKCCFCVPIRKGVTIFGYVNLILNFLSFPLLIYLLVEHLTKGKAVDPSFGHIDPLIHLPLTIAFCAIDVIMTIILLIGAHKKKKLLLKIYLYFGVVFQLVTLGVDLIYFDYRDYVENIFYFLFLSFNIYLLFLVYSIIHLIEESDDVQYTSYTRHQSQ